jgi:hypothetical protein
MTDEDQFQEFPGMIMREDDHCIQVAHATKADIESDIRATRARMAPEQERIRQLLRLLHDLQGLKGDVKVGELIQTEPVIAWRQSLAPANDPEPVTAVPNLQVLREP